MSKGSWRICGKMESFPIFLLSLGSFSHISHYIVNSTQRAHQTSSAVEYYDNNRSKGHASSSYSSMILKNGHGTILAYCRRQGYDPLPSKICYFTS
jgi:hypothetical protein